MSDLTVLFIGDIVGEEAVSFVVNSLPELKRTYQPDFCIVNGENAHQGKGIIPSLALKLKEAGVHCITSGNHIWDFRTRDTLNQSSMDNFLLRPANYPSTLPGKGVIKLRNETKSLLVINLQGTVFMENIEDPFRFMEENLIKFRTESKNILIDFHAEATSEKLALAHFLDGKVSAIIGTHTHVQTADEIILPNGTAYITDVGMTGPYHSVIGLNKDDAIKRFRDKIGYPFKLAKGPLQLSGVVVHIDPVTGKSTHIHRILVRQPYGGTK